MTQPLDSDDAPVCPHCEKRIDDFMSSRSVSDGETLYEQECPHCEKFFEVTIFVSFSFTTQKEEVAE
jgi:transcriptional regulator NrdR family protein